MKKLLLSLVLLSACSGGLSTGEGVAPGGGPVGGPIGTSASGSSSTVNSAQGGLTGSDGVLGSQSSSSDIGVNFYRDYALDFEGETDPSVALIEKPMISSSQAVGLGEVRKVTSTKLMALDSTVSSTLIQSAKRWVRALNCGNFPDSEIEKLIPHQDLGQPWTQDKLLWFVLNMPRPGKSFLAECRDPIYRDFLVEAGGKVDLSDLSGEAQDLFFFVQVKESEFPALGALSTSGETELSTEQWLEVAQHSKLRIVRLLPPGQPHRIHSIQVIPSPL